MAALGLNQDQHQGGGGNEEDKLSGKQKEGGGPGDVIIHPNKLEYNAPFSEKNVYWARLTNNGWRKIGWAHVTRMLCHMEFLKQVVEPNFGVLGINESVDLRVTCFPFEIDELDEEELNNTKISFEWTNTPAGAGDEYDESWMRSPRAVIATKDLKVQINKV